ncbi:MAG: ATP-grasp domain-containing protein [Syntrophales bacterium]|nr:ATP-grasp domain-containing protein [Syntrophales bacterium]
MVKSTGEIKRIRKLLIANRGEIALRIMRTCMEMGIISVAVYETPDAHSFFVKAAGETVLLGDGPVKDYLNIEKIINAAKTVEADAIHPGYGFLSENPGLAEACEAAGITFVGPNSDVLRRVGDKVEARRIAMRAGVPIIPGLGPLSSGEAGIREAVEFANRVGYPVMIKAVAGGGGRGIRKVASEMELKQQIPLAAQEALAAFGDGSLYLEKCVENARHVEIQILADNGGHIVHLGSRDCSIQRRNQKILEVAPASLPPEVTQRICAAALAIAKEAHYTNAGTVEFLVDRETHEFWFMEINARLQVEHTVTEEITGVDIVRQQIWIAEGEALDLDQDHLPQVGRAIQVRINAENPRNNFMPDAGRVVESYQAPGGPGVRLDGIVYPGYRIPSEYDSLLVKLTVRGFNWEQAVNRLQRALRGFNFSGVRTTIPLYLNICNDEDFRNERFGTNYIDTHPHIFLFEDDAQHLREVDRMEKGEIRSPVKGIIRSILVKESDIVAENDVIMTIESMKMICNIYAEKTGQIETIYFRPGDAVDFDDLLVSIRNIGGF